MKQNVKVDPSVVEKVKRASKKRGQTMGGFVESAIKQFITPEFVVFDNSDAFHSFLKTKNVKFKPNGHSTIVEVGEPIELGIEWGIYKALNDPKYKK